MAPMYKICALIPTYNHYKALPPIVARLLKAGLEVFIVDDGSDKETKECLKTLVDNNPLVHVLYLPSNQGKGAAIQAGFNWVSEAGYTHAFQLDADGQHSLENFEAFLQLSRKNPQALLSGQPIYDASMPLSRRIGRWITHIWVWIETLSFRIIDSMCGFRVYPIQQTLAVMHRQTVGLRMDFDTEIMVRLFWQGTPVIMSPVKVIYPEDNHSNFNVIDDNWRITKMHTRLFFGMLKNLPRVLFKRPNYKNLHLSAETNTNSWASMQEKGTFLGLSILAWCYRLLGRHICLGIGAPVAGYFYLTATEQRRASQDFLKQVWAHKKLEKCPGVLEGLRHFMNFLAMTLDKFAAWTGRMDWSKIDPKSLESFREIMSTGKGGMLLVSHLGNMEFCRAVSCEDHKRRVHVLLHSKNSQRFSQFLQAFNPQSTMNILEVTEIGPDTILYLKDRVEAGDWVVIAADRAPVSSKARVSNAEFLGKEAAFSQGPYVLAALLQCPVYTAIAIRQDGKFKVHMDLFAEKLILNRHSREADLKYYAQLYAKHLEFYCLLYPYQWFNFFDFWKK